jgi:hypothetical protein
MRITPIRRATLLKPYVTGAFLLSFTLSVGDLQDFIKKNKRMALRTGAGHTILVLLAACEARPKSMMGNPIQEE